MLYCKNGRLHPLRRCHKRWRSFPRDAAEPAFYPIKPWWTRNKALASLEFAAPGTRDAAGQTFIVKRLRIMQLTGAEITIRCLQEEGVEYVFGYPGGAVLNIYDELFKQEKVKHVLVRHEQGARARGRRLFALVAQDRRRAGHLRSWCHQRRHRHRDGVHGFDSDGRDHRPGADARHRPGRVPGSATRSASRGPCVKHNFLVKDVNELALTIKKAFYLAATGRPGPVLVDIPKDVTQALGGVRLSEDGVAALVQPGDQGPRRPDQEGRAAPARREEADDLHRRRRDPEQRGVAADAARAPAGLPVHEHADGPGRLPRHRPAVHRACRACTARTRPTWRCRNATC